MSTSRPKTRAQAKGRQAKAGSQKKKDGFDARLWGKRLGLAALGAALLGVIGFFIAYASTDIPKPNDVANAEASVIYFSDGKTEIDRISEINRESVALSKVPKSVQQAHLAAEDRDFYENSGISPTGIARGAWVTLRGGETQSGSTITQQYVKNYFLTRDQTLSRKAKEILISVKIAKQQSKDQILEDYLNTIYYGRGAYGIQTAARAYFNKDVSKLNAAEGAVLASVIKGPTFFDPGLGDEEAERAQDRWDYVMDGMASEGWMSQADREKATFPKTVKYNPNKGKGGPNGYLVTEVKKELEAKVKLSGADIDRGGYKIVTTIDKSAQAAAAEAVKDRMPKGEAGKGLRVGLTSIKPGDGAVVAMYGGSDSQKQAFNAATQAKLQAGSTYKVFTLMAALQQEISTKSRYDGSSPRYFEDFKGEGNATGKVTNFGFQSFGRIDLRTATANSVNTVYAELNTQVGPKKTREAAVAAGLPAKGLGDNAANVFGTDVVTVKDMANAYATIAANGVRVQPYMVKSVTGGPGELKYKAKISKKAVLDKDVTADTIDAMTQVVQRGSGQFASQLGRPAAGKTGTTTDNKSAWFDGFTPQLATAVGIYKGDATESMSNLPGFGELTGGSVPVRIWTDYMEAALKGQKVAQFPQRAGVGDDKVPTPTTTRTTPSSTSSSSSSTTTSKTTTTTTTTEEPTTEEPPETSEPTRPQRPTITTEEPGDTPTILGGGGGGDGDGDGGGDGGGGGGAAGGETAEP
jgi:membrane peptidoglycan carboxypeptidase